MNRKNLYILIVAVVAIGIVVGLWLTGAGQSGPLSGEVVTKAPKLTTLTLGVTVLGEGALGDRLIQFSGTLTDSGGAPVQGRTVSIMRDPNSPWVIETATTGTNGAYYVQHGEITPGSYFAVFAGDDQYGASQSSVINS